MTTIEKITTTTAMGLIMGMVMRQKRCHPFAPSISPASYRSCGTVCRPARKLIAKKGIPRHVLTRITENMAQPASPSQLMRKRPRQASFSVMSNTLMSIFQNQLMIQLKTLKVASNIHSQASPLSTVGTMKGSRMTARVKRAKRILRYRINASHIPKALLKMVAIAVKNTVFHAVCQKMALRMMLK